MEKGTGDNHVLYDSIPRNLASECPILAIPISFKLLKDLQVRFNPHFIE